MLTALYLPGTPHAQRLDRRRWLTVLGALRGLGLSGREAAGGLRAKGLFEEATALTAPEVLDWAADLIQHGRVETCLSPGYPERWLAVLGDLAPPAAWVRTAIPSPRPCLGIVGSRDVDPIVHRFCAHTARTAVDLGYRVVSGGAMGCDRAALDAAIRHGGSTLNLAPYGIELAEGHLSDRECVLSFSEPREPFSTGRAMERNTLIYAAGRVTVVGQVRFRQGGTWHGATGALRRRTTCLLVRRPGPYEPDEAVRGARALVGLGANYLDDPAQIADFLAMPTQDLGLFASLKVG